LIFRSDILSLCHKKCVRLVKREVDLREELRPRGLGSLL